LIIVWHALSKARSFARSVPKDVVLRGRCQVIDLFIIVTILPDGPKSIHVTMVKEEERVIGTPPYIGHIPSHKVMDRVVKEVFYLGLETIRIRRIGVISITGSRYNVQNQVGTVKLSSVNLAL
jgi:hypothetical protein